MADTQEVFADDSCVFDTGFQANFKSNNNNPQLPKLTKDKIIKFIDLGNFKICKLNPESKDVS
jgi:hypothetical protein